MNTSELEAGETQESSMAQAQQYAGLAASVEVSTQPLPEAPANAEALPQVETEQFKPAVLVDRQGERRESSLPIEIDEATKEVCRDYFTEQQRSMTAIHGDLERLRGSLIQASHEREQHEQTIRESTPDPAEMVLGLLSQSDGASRTDLDALMTTAREAVEPNRSGGPYAEAIALSPETYQELSGRQDGMRELMRRVEGLVDGHGSDMRNSSLMGKVAELAQERGIELPLESSIKPGELYLPGDEQYVGVTNEEINNLLQSAVEQTVKEVIPTKEAVVAKRLKAAGEAQRRGLVAEIGKVDAKITALFRTGVVPSQFIDEADLDHLSAIYDDRNRLVTEAGLGEGWVKDPAERVETIRVEQKQFAESLVPGDTLLIHGTPFIEDIIRDGQLRPSATKHTGGFNTNRSYDGETAVSGADGSLGVHFGNLSYGSDGYFINQHDGITGGSALVYPLAEIIEESPVGGARETSLVSSHRRGRLQASWPVQVSAELAATVGKQTEQHYEAARESMFVSTEEDRAFAAGVDIKLGERMEVQGGRAFGSPAYEFGYPVEKAHIIILGDKRGEEIRAVLVQTGYGEDWVASHLHIVQSEQEVIPLGKEIQANYKKTLGRTMIAPLCDVDERNQPIFSRV